MRIENDAIAHLPIEEQQVIQKWPNVSAKIIDKYLLAWANQEWLTKNKTLAQHIVSNLTNQGSFNCYEIFLWSLHKAYPTEEKEWATLLYSKNNINFFRNFPHPDHHFLKFLSSILYKSFEDNLESVTEFLIHYAQNSEEQHCVIDTICKYSKHMDVLKKALDVYENTPGFLDLLQKNAGEYLEDAMIRKQFSLIPILFEAMRKYKICIEETLLSHLRLFTFGGCDIETFKLLCQQLSSQQVRDILQQNLESIIFNAILSPHSNFSALLDFLKSFFDKSLIGTAVCARSDRCSLTAIDQACREGHSTNLKLLLDLPTDDELRIVLTTPNYGLHTPLSHCFYYFPNSGCSDLILEKLKALNIGQ